MGIGVYVHMGMPISNYPAPCLALVLFSLQWRFPTPHAHHHTTKEWLADLFRRWRGQELLARSRGLVNSSSSLHNRPSLPPPFHGPSLSLSFVEHARFCVLLVLLRWKPQVLFPGLSSRDAETTVEVESESEAEGRVGRRERRAGAGRSSSGAGRGD